MSIARFVDTLSDEVVVELFHQIILTLKVNHRTGFTFFIYKEQTGDAGILSHLGIVSTKSRRDMHDTGTILCSHIITGNHAESLTLHLHKLIFAVLTHEHLLRMSLSIGLHIVGGILIELCRRLYPRHQLLILQTNQLFTSIAAHNTIRHKLLALIVLRHLLTVSDISLWCEVSIQAALSQNDGDLLTVIGIIGLHSHIVNLRTDTEGSV